MKADPKALVAKGYDAVAQDYLDRFLASTVREAWLARFAAALPEKATVLDLGCGAGIPVAARLADLGHSVIGVDSSARQIALARSLVPGATFLRADMTRVGLPNASFDGIAAFYSLIHVPAGEQGALLGRIATWLKPCGRFVGTFGTGAAHDWTGEWLGTRMFFSHNSDAATLALLYRAGLAAERAEVVQQDNEDARFLWIIARRSARGV